MDMLKDKAVELYDSFMGLTAFKKAVVLLVVGLVAYYAYRHFWLNEGMEDGGENGVLRFFYADWCPHCKAVKPEWEKLKKAYKGDVVLKDVDCSKGRPSIAKKLEVEGFPTFIYSKAGEHKEYDGDRTAAGLKAFIKD